MADSGKGPHLPAGSNSVEGGRKKGKPKKTSESSADGVPNTASTSKQIKPGASSSVDGGEVKPNSGHSKPAASKPQKGSNTSMMPAQKEQDKQGKKGQQQSKVEGAGKLPAEQDKQGKKGQQQSKVEGAGKLPAGEGAGEQKSKAQLKAERRAIQEAQRAAKEAKKAEGGAPASGGATSVQHGASSGGAAVAAARKEVQAEKTKGGTGGGGGGEAASGPEKKLKKKSTKVEEKNLTEDEMWANKEREILGKSLKIDNNILNLGFQYFHHHIVGANARCMALLVTLKEVIAKYRTPAEKELSRDLEKTFLNPCISYINYCRPLSTSMGNAIKHLKHHISQIPSDMDDETAIAKLQEEIDSFIQINLMKAAEAVALYADSKIDDDDVILIYAASSLIGQVLKTAYKKGKRFRVIVVEGRPRTEGKSMLRYLVRCGIPCSYVYIGSASHAMSEATKVFLGAAAMFAIGDMYSRTGNSMIASLARTYNLPVLVCCETYKFTDKVQLHSGDSNLHARGKDLLSLGQRGSILTNTEGLGLLNLMYDVTQSRHITALVTELGMLPCTSVPVVLRRREDLTAEG